MAISPKQLEDSFLKDIDGFENHFDTLLKLRKISKGQSTYIDVPSKFNSTHFLEPHNSSLKKPSSAFLLSSYFG